jgi:hypothetical protein
MRKIGTISRAVGFAGFIISFAALIGFDYYIRTFPLIPDPQHGLTAAYSWKGINHYTTPLLRNSCNWAWGVGAVSFVLAALGTYAVNRDKNRS